jgi:hypothetical protein
VEGSCVEIIGEKKKDKKRRNSAKKERIRNLER